MTSKEILSKIVHIIHQHVDSFEYPDKQLHEDVVTIYKDLERLKELEKEYEKLFEICTKQAYLLNNKHIDKPIIEQLIKAIKDEIELLIERRFNAYACDNYEVYNVIDAIIEELKEVLGNA